MTIVDGSGFRARLRRASARFEAGAEAAVHLASEEAARVARMYAPGKLPNTIRTLPLARDAAVAAIGSPHRVARAGSRRLRIPRDQQPKQFMPDAIDGTMRKIQIEKKPKIAVGQNIAPSPSEVSSSLKILESIVPPPMQTS